MHNFRLLQAPGTTYVVVIAKDVTEQKRKELEYLQFSNVIHYTINPIQITDAKGKMVYVNPALERVSGFSRDELIGRNPNILNSGRHSREFWGKVWNHILSGKAWVGEAENRRKDGAPFHTELLISPIEDAAGTVVYTGRQSGYGAIVILRHQNGLVTLYAHNSAVLVKEGDEVAPGTPIARVGQSGRTTGPHLHFEVREGTRPGNPPFYLP